MSYPAAGAGGPPSRSNELRARLNALGANLPPLQRPAAGAGGSPPPALSYFPPVPTGSRSEGGRRRTRRRKSRKSKRRYRK
jgi:hypothetical protein